jgi:hypothetical protein
MRKTILGLVAAAALAVPLVGAVAPANAAPGDQLIANGDFSSYGLNGALPAPATTSFELAVPGAWGTGTGSMYDPGRYVIGTNPAAVHEAWADFSAANDPMMIVNGFTEGSQKVWSQTVTAPVCSTPGSKVTYDFTANATNILPPEWAAARGLDAPGANIEVKVNGTSIGSQNLTGVNPDQVVQFVGAVPAAASMEVTLWNNGTAYTGNDFAIDDISLIQRGDCAPPCVVTHNGVWFNYTGKYTGTGAPALTDKNWKALPAQPGGEHDVNVRGFDKPYQPGKDKGKGDWFVWKDLGNTCPTS